MAIIKAKPTSPGRRFRVLIREDLHKGDLRKHLLSQKEESLEEIIMAILQSGTKVAVIKDSTE